MMHVPPFELLGSTCLTINNCARQHDMSNTGQEGTMTRPRPARSVRLVFSLLACCCCCLRGEHQGSFSSSSRTAAVEGTSTRQHQQHQQHQRVGPHAGTMGFIARGLPVQGIKNVRLGQEGGGCDGPGSSCRSKSSTKRMMMNTTRAKRGAAGKGRKQNGVGKKVRRILEPASREEVCVLCVRVSVCLSVRLPACLSVSEAA